MTRSFRSGLVLSIAGSIGLVASGCMTHTRGDEVDAGPPVDAYAHIEPCDGCSAPRDTPEPDAFFDTTCTDQDARGEGPCEAELGYVWRGGGCVSISGCSCEGADCDDLATSLEECLAEHASCDRICGGFAEIGCGPTEYCDFPDGSFCGGDDSTGVCRPRPTLCSEPGGVPACGCDGVDYLFDCNAYVAGTDIREYGPCVTTHAYDTAKADRVCGPGDEHSWQITLTTARTSCDEAADDGSIEITVWRELERETPGTVFELGEDFGRDGVVRICGRAGEPCATAEGTFSFSVFAAGEVARFSFDVRTEDGRRFAETEMELARFWCALGDPGCA